LAFFCAGAAHSGEQTDLLICARQRCEQGVLAAVAQEMQICSPECAAPHRRKPKVIGGHVTEKSKINRGAISEGKQGSQHGSQEATSEYLPARTYMVVLIPIQGPEDSGVGHDHEQECGS